MIRIGLVLLLILGLQPRLHPAEQVAVSLHSLSVRFSPATADIFGLVYHSDVSSLFGDPTNGELYLLPGSQYYTHGGFLRLEFPEFPGEAFFTPLYLDIPSFADANTNGLHDFFEVSQAVPTTPTQGEYEDPLFGGSLLQATWSRAAGSEHGLCELYMPDWDLIFPHRIELIQYEGFLDYSISGVDRPGQVALEQVGQPSSLLGGPALLSVPDPDTVSLVNGTWTNASANTLDFQAPNSLERVTTNYSGFFLVSDGDPATSEADYLEWALMISDARDNDQDGVPDFTDPPLLRPTLSIALDEDLLLFTITGRVGETFFLEESSVLPGDLWIVRESGTLTNSVQSFSLPRPFRDATFWRLWTGN